MRASVLQENLAKGLSIVARAVDARPSLSVLGNVLLSTEESRIKLSATNLDMSITTYIGAKVDQQGAITLPAKTLSELVNTLSPERVDLLLDLATQSVNVRCGMTTSNVRGIAASEFPLIPTGSDQAVLVPGRVLKEMIQQTVFAASKEDTRPILTGVYTQFDGDVMTMAAADGYRLAVRTARIDNAITRDRAEMVIPAKALAEVARIISDDDEEVGITLPGDRDIVMFHMVSTDLSSSLLEGRFPDFTAIIPKAYQTAATIYTTDFLRACKRAEIFARENNNSARIVVTPPGGAGEMGTMMINSKSNERGDIEAPLDAGVEGESLEAAFNVRYLIDALSAIGEERVILESNGSSHPGVIRPEGREDFICLVMPMSLNR